MKRYCQDHSLDLKWKSSDFVSSINDHFAVLKTQLLCCWGTACMLPCETDRKLYFKKRISASRVAHFYVRGFLNCSIYFWKIRRSLLSPLLHHHILRSFWLCPFPREARLAHWIGRKSSHPIDQTFTYRKSQWVFLYHSLWRILFYKEMHIPLLIACGIYVSRNSISFSNHTIFLFKWIIKSDFSVLHIY